MDTAKLNGLNNEFFNKKVGVLIGEGMLRNKTIKYPVMVFDGQDSKKGFINQKKMTKTKVKLKLL